MIDCREHADHARIVELRAQRRVDEAADREHERVGGEREVDAGAVEIEGVA